jgi:hypothetical protein
MGNCKSDEEDRVKSRNFIEVVTLVQRDRLAICLTPFSLILLAASPWLFLQHFLICQPATFFKSSQMLVYLALLVLSVNAQSKCNGWAEFCDLPFDKVALPSTHNSFAYQQNSNLPSSPFINQNGGWDIKAQLEGISLYPLIVCSDGVRAFELDVYEDDSILKLCHFSCSPLLGYEGSTLKEAGQTFLDFLTANLNEVIMITFENVDQASAAELRADLSAEMIAMAYIHPSPSASWPLYKSMIADNTRVVFLANSGGDSSTTDFLLPQGQYLARTDYKITSSSAFNCDPRDSDSSTNPNALFQLNHMLSTSLSDSIYYPDTGSIDETNSLASINKQVAQCSRQINFINVDFGQTGDLMKAVATYNGVTPPAAPTRPTGEVSSASITISSFIIVILGLALF